MVVIKDSTHKVPNGTECIDVIGELEFSYNVGVAFSYLWRSKKKGDYKSNIDKAIVHLQDEIFRIEQKEKQDAKD